MEETKGTLKVGEPHPAAYAARDWMLTIPYLKLIEYQGSFANVAMSGNRLAEICFETLTRWLKKKPVSDRYILGLAWSLRRLEDARKEEEKVNHP